MDFAQIDPLDAVEAASVIRIVTGWDGRFRPHDHRIPANILEPLQAPELTRKVQG
jgi:hypothetical protein